jgi:hypothetical protein
MWKFAAYGYHICLMNRISLAGYLGNQLFQLAFAHELQFREPKSKVRMFNFTDKPSKAENFLERLNLNCSHVEYRESPWPAQIQVRVSNKLSMYSMMNHEQIQKISRVINTNESNLQFEEISGSWIWLGYFQNIRLVPNGVRAVVSELKERIGFEFKQIDGLLQSNLEALGKYQVIHVRRNDMKDPENAPFGILQPEFYATHLKANLPIVCTTDDEFAIQDIINLINPELIVGKNDVTPIQAIAIMSKANHLVAANSTMSFWGSLLCAENGGTSIFPIPRTSPAAYFDATDLYPGFQLAQGVFY